MFVLGTVVIGMFLLIGVMDILSISQCMMEGLGLAFQPQPQFSANMGQKNEVYAQVSQIATKEIHFL